MPKRDSSPAPAGSILNGAADRIRTCADEGMQRALVYTRESPMLALGCAAVAGYLLRALPVRALTGALFDLVLVLMRPVALIFGAVKVYDFAVRNLPNCCAVQKPSSGGET